jgi:hypothetical protein
MAVIRVQDTVLRRKRQSLTRHKATNKKTGSKPGFSNAFL